MQRRRAEPLPSLRADAEADAAPVTTGSDRALLALPPLLAVLLYLPAFGVGYLADDFLFLEWARQGLSTLLDRVTAGSDPQMFRPWPALLWTLPSFPGGAAALHGLSVALHGLSSALVAMLAVRLSGRPLAGVLLGSLFAAFPLFAEPVVWLSSSFDLWATAAALGALCVLAGELRHRAAAAACLFAFALACKESVAALPFVAVLVLPRRRRETVPLFAVFAAYVGLRLVLFGGLGGYAVDGARTAIPSVDPLFFLRNALLQIPYRVASAVRAGEEGALWLFAATVLAALALAVALRAWRQWSVLATGLAVYLLALLPAAPVLSIDVDHEGSRLVYFAIAATLPCLARLLVAPPKLAVFLLAAATAAWSTVSVAHLGAWREGGRIVRETLELMASEQARYPAGSRIFVAAPELHDGAYVWRNGLVSATRLAGLRSDLSWELGTAGLLPPVPADVPGKLATGGLGVDAFELALAGDTTRCALDIRSGRGRPATLMIPTAITNDQWVTDVVSAPPGGGSGLFVEVVAGGCDLGPADIAWLAWRPDAHARWRRSNGMELRLGRASRSFARLPPLNEPSVQFRVDLPAGIPLECRVDSLHLGVVPATCPAGHP